MQNYEKIKITILCAALFSSSLAIPVYVEQGACDAKIINISTEQAYFDEALNYSALYSPSGI